MSEDKFEQQAQSYWQGVGMVTGMMFGVMIGLPLGIAMENIAIGVAIGAGMGLSLGVAIGQGMQKKNVDNPPSPEKVARFNRMIGIAMVTGVAVLLLLVLLFILR